MPAEIILHARGPPSQALSNVVGGHVACVKDRASAGVTPFPTRLNDRLKAGPKKSPVSRLITGRGRVFTVQGFIGQGSI